MATLVERLREQVAKQKREAALKGSVSKVASSITDTAKLAAAIRARQASSSTIK